MKATTKHNLIGLTMLAAFMFSGNSEAQTANRLTAEQAANRAELINQWSDGAFRACINNGATTVFCHCLAGGMRETPVADILVATVLANNGVPLNGTRAYAHILHVQSICLPLNR